MKLRRILFWIHLSAGVLAGVVVLVIAATGILLAYRPQLLRWPSHNYKVASSERLSLVDLITKVPAQSAMPSSLTLLREEDAPAELSYGKERIVYLNPATGQVLGESRELPAFFAEVEELHRWLGASSENRPIGEAVTGVCNLVFLVLILTGPFIWWPREWTWNNLKKIVLFLGGLKGRALYWNWHNVFGIWCVTPLFLIVLTGTIMSYPWATNLLYRITGNKPPLQQSSTARQRNRPANPGREHDYKDAAELDGLENLVTSAERQVPQWKSLTIRFPSERSPLVLFADEGDGGRPDLRSQFSLDSKTSEVRVEMFSSYNSGRRLRTWARFSHTGEAAGIFGQTIAASSAMGALVLAFTGLTLNVKRFLAWRLRRQAASS